MHITPDLAADLALLTQALERPESDLITTLYEFAADARVAVRSYLGLSLVTVGEAPFTLTALEEAAYPEDIRSSVLVPLLRGGSGAPATGPTLILYGAQPGAFVDLAADLSWLSSIPLAEYVLDQHLSVVEVPSAPSTVHQTSVINQAIGALIARGHPPEEAHEDLTVRAAAASTDRYGAAIRLLAALAPDGDL